MSIPILALIGIAMLAASPAARAQPALVAGPTVGAARVALSAPEDSSADSRAIRDDAEPCGSAWKNAAMLGLGLSLAAGTLELTYTLVREPFVRNGRSWPRADPALIAWAGGAGFVIGLVGTEMCRRRHR